MRGKKTDPAFISLFIQESVAQGCETPEEIVRRAKRLIEQIDEEIRSIEAKKVTRSKLLDVIVSFEKPVKDKTEEAKLLSFFKLNDPATCKFLCDMVKIKPISSSEQKLDLDARFAIKQLLECRVLAREVTTDKLVQGERFDEYMKFVLREDL